MKRNHEQISQFFTKRQRRFHKINQFLFTILWFMIGAVCGLALCGFAPLRTIPFTFVKYGLSWEFIITCIASNMVPLIMSLFFAALGYSCGEIGEWSKNKSITPC